MEIKKVEKFEFNGVLYDTENEAKIEAGTQALVKVSHAVIVEGGNAWQAARAFLELGLEEIQVVAEAAEILTTKAKQPAPEAVQADWPAKGWKKVPRKFPPADNEADFPEAREATGKTRKPYSEARGEVEERFGGVQAYKMEEVEEAKGVQHLTVEDGIVSDRIRRKGETYILETEEVKNSLEFVRLTKVRTWNTGDARRYEELRKILGV